MIPTLITSLIEVPAPAKSSHAALVNMVLVGTALQGKSLQDEPLWLSAANSDKDPAMAGFRTLNKP